MLDPFLPVFYTRDGDAFHDSPNCSQLSRYTSAPRRSRLASMLATKRHACSYCAPHLALTRSQAMAVITAPTAVLA